MPRRARILLANTPHHIVQRGHNRETVFVERDDYLYYLDTLKEWKQELEVNVYGYCLMTNHVHLILDPRDEPANIGKLMKRLAGRQTRYVNYQEKRSGSLWEGRYKSSPIETDSYLLACHRYVERNPVKAGMVEDVADYEWSSYRQHVGLEDDIWIDSDPAYKGLSNNAEARMIHYKNYVSQSGSESETHLIKSALQRGQLTGGNRFIEDVEKRLGLRIEHRGPGRPRRMKK
jgi:REP-associated tyrosine transposase